MDPNANNSTTLTTESSTPSYITPICYITQQSLLKPEHINKLQLETLFYMFFVFVKDLLQLLSATELYRREWKFHSELLIWVKARSQQEQSQSNPNVQYIYFDVNNWEIKPFHINNFNTKITTINQLLLGFVNEDEIKNMLPK